MKRIPKKITVILILGILLTSSLIIFYPCPSGERGLLIKLEFTYGSIPKAVSENEARILVNIEAITPKGDLQRIYKTLINNTKQLSFILDPQQNADFDEILKDWLNRLKNEPNQKSFKTALIFDVWVIYKNGTSFRLEPPKAIPYNPLTVNSEKVPLTITIDDIKLVKVNDTSSKFLFEGTMKNEYDYKEDQFAIYYWETNYSISSYSLSSDGYIEVPVMILNNLNPDAPLMQAFIDITFSGSSNVVFHGVASYGDNIYERAKNGLHPQMINYLIKEPILEHKVAFTENNQVYGGEKKYYYITAKAVAYHQREVKVTYIANNEVSREYTGRERIIQCIYDIKTYPSGRICGGERNELPYFMDFFLQATYVSKVIILDDPYLSDGDLDPFETAPLSLIYRNIGAVHQFPFSVGAPVGALMAHIVNSVYPNLNFMIDPLLACFVSINIGNNYVGGGIKNSGSPNKSAELYVALSNYKYYFGNSLNSVPAGTYFVFKEVNSSLGNLFLLTYSTKGYIKESSFNIYPGLGELTYQHEIKTIPIIVGDRVLFRLIGDEKTISYIDYVKFYAMLDNESIVELTLTKAYHNVFGDITHFLVEDDDWKVVIAGREHTTNGGHIINLEFSIPITENIVGFLLEIRGNSLFI